MQQPLPEFSAKDLPPTRDYLREICLVLGGLQRAFIDKHPRDWQHGLVVTGRGLSTQPMHINGQSITANLDLIDGKVRFGENSWQIQEHSPRKISGRINDWLSSNHQNVELEVPILKANLAHFSADCAEDYSRALWWAHGQFSHIKSTLKQGVTSPILLYPHHFDLSLAWFPKDDDEQIGLGFSTGDQTITEPYFYITFYPEPAGLTYTKLAEGAYWQTKGFTGAILPYDLLAKNSNPAKLFKNYTSLIFKTLR